MISYMKCPQCQHVWAVGNHRVDLDGDAMAQQYAGGASIRQVAATAHCSYAAARRRIAERVPLRTRGKATP